MSRSPFRGLTPYGPKDAERFFGRERETGRLYNALHESNLVVIHGGARSGKSSVVQCGLGSQLVDADWLPLFLTCSPWVDNTLDMIVRMQLWRGSHPARLDDSSIVENLRALYLDHYRTIYLVFESFEQLLLHGEPAVQQSVYETIRQILHAALPCKILIEIREEYLADLSAFERTVPGLLDHRLRIESPDDATMARIVLGTLAAAGVRVVDEAGTVAAIMANVRGRRDRFDLAGLQIYLDRLWRADQLRQGTATPETVTFDVPLVDQLGPLGSEFATFLDERGTHTADYLFEQLRTMEDQLWQEDVTIPEIPLQTLFSTLDAAGRPDALAAITAKPMRIPEAIDLENILPPSAREAERQRITEIGSGFEGQRD